MSKLYKLYEATVRLNGHEYTSYVAGCNEGDVINSAKLANPNIEFIELKEAKEKFNEIYDDLGRNDQEDI